MRILKLMACDISNMLCKSRFFFKVNGEIQSYHLEGYYESEHAECAEYVKRIKAEIKKMIDAGDKIEEVSAPDLGVQGVKVEYIPLIS
jgi:hypothetical protein